MRSAIASVLLIVTVAACGHDRSTDVPSTRDEVAQITLSAPTLDPLTSTGDTRTVTATATDATGSPVTGAQLTWSTSAPSVVTVSGSGTSAVVTAVDDGTAEITASSGRVERKLTITVRRRVVSINVSARDTVVVAGETTQLTVVGSDARGQPIMRLAGLQFVTSNPFSVDVTQTGLVTALFSPFNPMTSVIRAFLIGDGFVLVDSVVIRVGSAAPPDFQFAALLLPEGVRPEPVNAVGQGVVFFTPDGAQVRFKMLWALMTGSPVSAHIHGPDGDDTVADILVDLPLGTPTDNQGVVSGSFSAANIRSQGGRPPVSLDSVVTLLRRFPFAYVDVHSALFPDGEMRGAVNHLR